MKRFLAFSLFLVIVAPAIAQRTIRPFPKEARAARTVAVVNNTHNEAVEQGAMEALVRWGHYKVVDDSDAAELVLTFEKKSEHTGNSSQKTGEDGKPSTSYSMSFGSSIQMKASVKGASVPFYTTSTSESKKKAGAACVTDLQAEYNAGP